MTIEQLAAIQSRRRFLKKCGAGISTAAFANLLSAEGYSTDSSKLPRVNPMAPRRPHFAPKAKNIILMYQSGAPSQLDLFDPKPGLSKWNGESLPPSLTKDLKLAFIKPNAKIMASPYKFKRYGQIGMEFSELVPHLGTCADDICMDSHNEHGGVQPRSGSADAYHGTHPVWSTINRFMGSLWPRK